MVPWKLGSLFIQACLACIALTRIVHAVSVPCPSGLNASMHARPHYIMCLHNPLELVSSAIYSAGYWGECEMYPFIIYDSLKRSVADGIVSGQSQETHRVTLPVSRSSRESTGTVSAAKVTHPNIPSNGVHDELAACPCLP